MPLFFVEREDKEGDNYELVLSRTACLLLLLGTCARTYRAVTGIASADTSSYLGTPALLSIDFLAASAPNIFCFFSNELQHYSIHSS